MAGSRETVPVVRTTAETGFLRTLELGDEGWLPQPLIVCIDPPDGATWRSGYAAVCKTVYTSSILVVASIHIINGLAGLYERLWQLSQQAAFQPSGNGISGQTGRLSLAAGGNG